MSESDEPRSDGENLEFPPEDLPRVRTLLEGLPFGEREVLQARFFEGRSLEEIAQALSMTRSEAGFLLYLGQRAVRHALAHPDDE